MMNLSGLELFVEHDAILVPTLSFIMFALRDFIRFRGLVRT